MQILLKYLPKILLGLLISLAVFTGYHKIKSIGYNEAKAEQALVDKAHLELITSKIDSIELLATSIANNNRSTNTRLITDIAILVKNAKGKPLTIIKNGKCLPSQVFSDSFTEITKRTNQTIKESQK